MARIVVACAAQTGREQLSRLLASAGFSPFCVCASGGEVRRVFGSCEDGILVIHGRMPDCTADELCWDLAGKALVLLLARPEVLALCEAPAIFRLEAPCTGNAVIAAVQMLEQLHRMRLPRRGQRDDETVTRAKQVLMMRYHITEPEAHRMLQKYAMDHGVRLAEYAARILQEERVGKD